MRLSLKIGQLALVRGVWTGLAFASTLLIGRLFGASVTGTYFLSLSLVTILITIAQLGLDLPVMRWVAVSHERNDPSHARAITNSGLRLAGIAALAAASVAILSASRLSELFSDPNLAGTIRIMSIAVPPAALAFILGRAYSAVGRPVIGEITQRLGFQAAFVLLILALFSVLGDLAVSVAYSAAHWIVFLAALVWWMRTVPSSAESKVDRKALLRAATPLLAASSTYLLVEWSDTLMIGYYLNPSAVGIYGVALRVSGVLNVVLAVATSIAGPKYASLHEDSDASTLATYARRVTRICGLAVAPMLLLLVLSPGSVMGLFGNEFKSGSQALVILAAGQALNVAVGPLGVLLTMTGRERHVFGITVAAAIFNVVLNFALIPTFGIQGAATATAASLVVVNGITLSVVSRQLGIRPFTLRSH